MLGRVRAQFSFSPSFFARYMILDIAEYRYCYSECVQAYEEKDVFGITEFCVLYGVPLIAGYTFVLEKYPEDKVAKEKLDKLMSFYHYDKVKG